MTCLQAQSMLMMIGLSSFFDLQVVKGSLIDPSSKLKREWQSQDLRVKVLALRMVMLQVRIHPFIHPFIQPAPAC